MGVYHTGFVKETGALMSEKNEWRRGENKNVGWTTHFKEEGGEGG